MSDVLEQDAANHEVVVECEIEGSPEKVWRALTVPELIGEWLDVEETGTQAGSMDQRSYEIIEALPFSRVRYAWNDHLASVPETFVTFDLTPMPGGRTWFRLTHSVEATTRSPVAANTNRPALARAA